MLILILLLIVLIVLLFTIDWDNFSTPYTNYPIREMIRRLRTLGMNNASINEFLENVLYKDVISGIIFAQPIGDTFDSLLKKSNISDDNISTFKTWFISIPNREVGYILCDTRIEKELKDNNNIALNLTTNIAWKSPTGKYIIDKMTATLKSFGMSDNAVNDFSHKLLFIDASTGKVSIKETYDINSIKDGMVQHGVSNSDASRFANWLIGVPNGEIAHVMMNSTPIYNELKNYIIVDKKNDVILANPYASSRYIVKCANENESSNKCKTLKSIDNYVLFGVIGDIDKVTSVTVDNYKNCDTVSFGGDPAPNQLKSCYRTIDSGNISSCISNTDCNIVKVSGTQFFPK